MSLSPTKLSFCLSYSVSKFSPFLSIPSSFSSFHLHYHSQSPSLDHDNVHDVVSQFHRMFHMRPVPPIYQFGQILGSLARGKHYSTTISLFKQMEFKDIQINLVILNIVMNCFCHLGQMPFSFSVFAKILKLGYHPDVITLSTLMKGLRLNSEVEKALTFHDKAVAQRFRFDEITYGILINGLCKVRETEAAVKLLRLIEGGLCKSDVVMYSTVIASLFKDKLAKQTYDLIIKMISNNIMPNVFIYSIMMNALCKEGKLKEAKTVLGVMVKAFVKPDIVTFSILMDGYSLLIEVKSAKHIFNVMTQIGVTHKFTVTIS
ncbi:hypothetical protein LR48_Vigan02g233300 [Vigna angularis]|uniref:Pentacotripeptide-repeat region of PRORP domain-containing protein n=2 Tax=Phaseolus angularis TaxID=3914 RepID=A0A0L9U018_PHAAN|nr:putative pentatricopeptide repeat-containing protein At1g12700, mitochondrial [Vigna angularis]KAG2401384.1 uncharacterized protein HKW66_Vig0195800 [Vigna angularis]KOM36183.1 hypothetical protein LR48_Vigan02g233300 [Vigna angularis]BAT93980.1 hypothetical protein VIGAN_08054200 [Vigna angularis var. angularis]